MKDLDTGVGVDPEEANAEEDEELRGRKRKLSGKKLTLFIILPVLLFGGGGAGVYFSGLANPLLAEIGALDRVPQESAPKAAFFYDLPELLVNINSGGKQSRYLKLKVALELEDVSAAKQLDLVLPRIIDNFQVYLRELRQEDLKGSAGLFRLKEELLVRVNAASKPIRVNDILFKEMIVQ